MGSYLGLLLFLFFLIVAWKIWNFVHNSNELFHFFLDFQWIDF